MYKSIYIEREREKGRELGSEEGEGGIERQVREAEMQLPPNLSLS